MNNIHKKVVNFSAGPAKLPEPVLEKAKDELLNYNNSGISVMEMSHRSAQFAKIINKTESDLKELLNVPDNYKILFLQGGGTGEFAAVPLNLMNLKPDRCADYVFTGSWSAKAAKEAEKYGKVNRVLPKVDKYTGIPDVSEWTLDPKASYIFICMNETIHGIEYQSLPDLKTDVPIVVDASSNFLSRPMDVSKYGLIFAGAQKNVGCAGVTVVIIREDLIGYALPECPIIFDYKVQVGMNSLYNTPPTYSIYIMGLVFDWIKEQGGLDVLEARNKLKSDLVYNLMDQSNGFYWPTVNKKDRSRMNIVLRIGSKDGNEELEKKFVDEAQKQGLIQLKGHRSVGGIRVSAYNAITVEEIQRLVAFMRDFMMNN